MSKNSGITLVDVREEAFKTIQDLRDGTIDIKKAQSIKDLLNVINDTAKTQVAFIQAMPKTVREGIGLADIKAIAGTLKDRDAEIDLTLHQIEQNQKKPYK